MSNLLAFLAVAILLVVTPGPDMALVTRNALSGGRRAALLTALGVEAGLLVWTAASALGLAALLQTSALAFTVVKLAGAAYLVYLGLRTLASLRGARTPDRDTHNQTAHTCTEGAYQSFRQGLLSNVLNPKIAVFFTSLIPQFVTPGPTAAWESTVLAGLFVLLGLIWLTTYAAFASAAGQLLRRPAIKRTLDALTGTILVGFGVRLATDTR